MNYSLKTLQLSISVETDQASMEGHFDNLLVAIKSKFTDITNKFVNVKNGKNEIPQLANSLKVLNFMDIRKQEINVPPNFTGRMGEYADALQDSVNLGSDIIHKILIPARKHFEKLLGSPELLGSMVVNSDDPIGSAKYVAQVNSLRDRISKAHSVGGKQTSNGMLPIGDIYSNNEEIQKVCNIATALNSRITTNTDLLPKTIDEQVEKLNSVVIKLQGYMKDDVRYSSNVDTIKSMSSILFDIATVVEFYAGTYQLTVGLKNSHIVPMINVLNDLSKNK